MRNRFSKLKGSETYLVPMIDYFNMLDDEKFLVVLEYLSKGWGFGLKNNYACTFVDNGVKFIDANGIEGKSILLDYSEFYEFLKIACEDYLIKNEKNESMIKIFLERLKESFL